MLIHLLGGGFWVSADAPPEPVPPDGPPTNLSIGTWGSPVSWSVAWDNGDPLAYTRVHRAEHSGTFGSSIFVGSINPGGAELLTDDATEGAEFFPGPSPVEGDYTYWVYHRRDGIDSTEVEIDTTTV